MSDKMEGTKEGNIPTDYQKAMLYHSDRADKYMDEIASLQDQLAAAQRKNYDEGYRDGTTDMENTLKLLQQERADKEELLEAVKFLVYSFKIENAEIEKLILKHTHGQVIKESKTDMLDHGAY